MDNNEPLQNLARPAGSVADNRTHDVIDRLVALYERPFGGKPRGRYRISMKLMCRIVGQRRVWPEQVEAIRRGLYERGYQLVDQETYFAIVSQQTFVSYRRVNEASIDAPPDATIAAGD
jgi:hypothetical protein